MNGRPMKTCWMTTAFPAPTICAIVCVCVATAGGALSQTAPSPGQASAPAAPPPQMAPMCDGPCVQANMDRAAKACARPIEAQSPTDFKWLARSVHGDIPRGGQIVAAERHRRLSRQFHPVSDDAEGMDTRRLSVRIRHGGAESRRGPRSSGAARPAAARASFCGATRQTRDVQRPAAGFGADRGRHRQGRRSRGDQRPQSAARSNRTIKFGEPSSIAITQMAPSASP